MSEEENRWLSIFREEERRLGNHESRDHHWWPKTLQGEWRSFGKLTRWSKVAEARNHKYGAEKGAHDVFVLTPDGKNRLVYEGSFRHVDNSIKSTVNELRLSFSKRSIWKDAFVTLWKAYSARLRGSSPSASRLLLELPLEESTALGLARIACSVSIRSPGNRRRLAAREKSFLGEDEALAVGFNVIQQWRHAEEVFASCPIRLDMILVRALQGAFVFPDAFPLVRLIDNKGLGIPLTSRLLFPILPEICIVGLIRVSTHRNEIRCWTLNADQRHVSDMNAYLSSLCSEYLYGIESTDHQAGSAAVGKEFLDSLWKMMA